MNASARTGRIVLLTTSHRVAPGLLSWPAWEALRTADRVVCADAGHPQLPYIREAGVRVDAGTEPEARELLDECAGGRTTVVVASPEGEPRLTGSLAALAGSGNTAMPELELLPGSYDLPGARLLDLVQVMDSIRRDCPWSGARTHEGLVKYGIEEMYELVEAIEEGDRAALCEELGDVLLQVIFHARIAQEDPDEPFSIDDVAGGIVEKLIHRHPHVFGEEQAATAEDVREHWLRTKAVEKRRDSVTEGIPLGQPALALAAKLAGRVRLAGLEVLEVPGGLPTGTDGSAGDGVGDAGEGHFDGAVADVGYELLALAVRAEAEGTDPETALRAAARTYRDAIRAAEGLGPAGDAGEGEDGEDGEDSGDGW